MRTKGALTNWDNVNKLKRNSDRHRCENCGKQARTMRDSQGRCVECQGLVAENSKGALPERNPVKVNYENEFETDHPAAEDEQEPTGREHLFN